MGWRESLETLRKQFEARAAQSRGLHHLMVEVADDERERMRGPDWFVRESHLESSDPATFLRADPWCAVQGSGLPGLHPRFREVRPGEGIDGIPQDRIVRDRSGAARAVFEPLTLRCSYLCGDHTALKGFESLAEAASRVLTDVPELTDHEYAEDMIDLFRKPRGGIRYVSVMCRTSRGSSPRGVGMRGNYEPSNRPRRLCDRCRGHPPARKSSPWTRTPPR